ncbi:MAG TPA: hypothetical protein VFY58_09480 [Nocardioides sp.]|nr:hypothetical protein [Nocardioides sp.]
MSRVVLVPGTLALLPDYASIEDPVTELRTACRAAVRWLAEAGPVFVLAGDQGRRVAEHLVAEAGGSTRPGSSSGDLPAADAAVLVVGNGSARRTEKAPGHFDERAAGFDDALGRCLEEPRPDALRAVDRELARELWADLDAVVELARLPDLSLVQVDYDDDPFGVQYWVIRWASGQP